MHKYIRAVPFILQIYHDDQVIDYIHSSKLISYSMHAGTMNLRTHVTGSLGAQLTDIKSLSSNLPEQARVLGPIKSS